jgi:hypothetical protein
MPSVLTRLFHRQTVREAAEHKHFDPGETLVALGPHLTKPANDPNPLEPKPLAPANDPAPMKQIKPFSDEETVEQQIAALLSAWDKASLCARRKFLTRIDQRIMTAHLARAVSRNPAGDGAATDDEGRTALLPATASPAAWT